MKHPRVLEIIVCLATWALIFSVQLDGAATASGSDLVQQQKNAAKNALMRADKNGDGQVSRDEFNDEFKAHRRLFRRFDRNKDGALTLSEFEAWMVPPEKAIVHSLGPKLADASLLKRLKTGGLVIIFRHGRATGARGKRPFDYYDCTKQRNLSDEGREELRQVGNAIRSIGIPVSAVQSSPMCRTRETAWLVFGQVTPNNALRRRKAVAERRMLAGKKPPAGKNSVLVSHGLRIRSVVWFPINPETGTGLPQGHAFILEPLGNSKYQFLAKLGPEDWFRLSRMVANR